MLSACRFYSAPESGDGGRRRPQPVLHLLMVHQSGLLHDRPPSIEHREVRYALDPESSRKLRIAFRINLHHHGFAGQISSSLRNFWRGRAARAAPCRPEIRQHRHTRILHDFIKELRIHFKRFGERGEITFACSAAAGIGQVAGRNPVLASATVACS